MKKHRLICMLICLITPNVYCATFNSGGTHNINYTINDYLDVDHLGAYDSPTTVNLLDDGWVTGGIRALLASKVNIIGGTSSVLCKNRSVVSISGGSVGYANAFDNSTLNISGGEIDSLTSKHDSHLYLEGGSVASGSTFTFEFGGNATFYGSDFKIKGQSIADGTYTPATLPNRSIYDHLTGTLKDSTLLGIYLYFEPNTTTNSTVTFVTIPEPTTILLLGLGGLILRRK